MKSQFEMPTPCQNCGEFFDLHDGYGSEKWFPNTVICENCHYIEEKEIEEDERWEEINIELSTALFGLDEEKGVSNLLDEENKKSIISLAKLLEEGDEELLKNQGGDQ